MRRDFFLAKYRRNLTLKGPMPLRYVFLLSFVFFIFSTALGFWIINKSIEPTLIRYADMQTKQIASLVINKAISDNNISKNGLDAIEIVQSKDGKPPVAKLNPDVINRYLSETTDQIQSNLQTAQSGDLQSLEKLTDVTIETNPAKNSSGIVWYIPLGMVTNTALFGNMGPKIPVRFYAIGAVQPNVDTTFKPMGINNTWIDVTIHYLVSVQIILPFSTQVTKIEENIPVGGTLIQGNVPQYYNGGGTSNPSIQLPKAN